MEIMNAEQMRGHRGTDGWATLILNPSGAIVAQPASFPPRLKPHVSGYPDGGAEAPPLQSKDCCNSLGYVFSSLGTCAIGEEGLSQGLKPVLWRSPNVRTKVQTYLRGKSLSLKQRSISRAKVNIPESCGRTLMRKERA